jgi:Domain of unknown function (DUF4157)
MAGRADLVPPRGLRQVIGRQMQGRDGRDPSPSGAASRLVSAEVPVRRSVEVRAAGPMLTDREAGRSSTTAGRPSPRAPRRPSPSALGSGDAPGPPGGPRAASMVAASAPTADTSTLPTRAVARAQAPAGPLGQAQGIRATAARARLERNRTGAGPSNPAPPRSRSSSPAATASPSRPGSRPAPESRQSPTPDAGASARPGSPAVEPLRSSSPSSAESASADASPRPTSAAPQLAGSPSHPAAGRSTPATPDLSSEASATGTAPGRSSPDVGRQVVNASSPLSDAGGGGLVAGRAATSVSDSEATLRQLDASRQAATGETGGSRARPGTVGRRMAARAAQVGRSGLLRARAANARQQLVIRNLSAAGAVTGLPGMVAMRTSSGAVQGSGSIGVLPPAPPPMGARLRPSAGEEATVASGGQAAAAASLARRLGWRDSSGARWSASTRPAGIGDQAPTAVGRSLSVASPSAGQQSTRPPVVSPPGVGRPSLTRRAPGPAVPREGPTATPVRGSDRAAVGPSSATSGAPEDTRRRLVSALPAAEGESTAAGSLPAGSGSAGTASESERGRPTSSPANARVLGAAAPPGDGVQRRLDDGARHFDRVELTPAERSKHQPDEAILLRRVWPGVASRFADRGWMASGAGPLGGSYGALPGLDRGRLSAAGGPDMVGLADFARQEWTASTASAAAQRSLPRPRWWPVSSVTSPMVSSSSLLSGLAASTSAASVPAWTRPALSLPAAGFSAAASRRMEQSVRGGRVRAGSSARSVVPARDQGSQRELRRSSTDRSAGPADRSVDLRPGASLRSGAPLPGPGDVTRGDRAQRFTQTLRMHRPDPTVALPSHLQVLARAIAGPAEVKLRSGPSTRAALVAAGRPAATVGRIIHLAARPDASTRSAEIVAHELVHAARPSPRPRFFDDDRHSDEETLAQRTGGLIRTLTAPGGSAMAASLSVPLVARSARGVSPTPAADLWRAMSTPAATSTSRNMSVQRALITQRRVGADRLVGAEWPVSMRPAASTRQAASVPQPFGALAGIGAVGQPVAQTATSVGGGQGSTAATPAVAVTKLSAVAPGALAARRHLASRHSFEAPAGARVQRHAGFPSTQVAYGTSNATRTAALLAPPIESGVPGLLATASRPATLVSRSLARAASGPEAAADLGRGGAESGWGASQTPPPAWPRGAAATTRAAVESTGPHGAVRSGRRPPLPGTLEARRRFDAATPLVRPVAWPAHMERRSAQSETGGGTSPAAPAVMPNMPAARSEAPTVRRSRHLTWGTEGLAVGAGANPIGAGVTARQAGSSRGSSALGGPGRGTPPPEPAIVRRAAAGATPTTSTSSQANLLERTAGLFAVPSEPSSSVASPEAPGPSEPRLPDPHHPRPGDPPIIRRALFSAGGTLPEDSLSLPTESSSPPISPEAMDWIIETIEQRVVEELERRGLRNNPGVF